MFRYLRTRKLLEQVSLTPEGVVYLVVLCFITVGSVLRNVNLLILMAGMMYAPLLVNWRLAVRRLRSFRASRQLPHRIHANRMVGIQWECENRVSGIPAFNVIVEDQIRRAAQQDQNRRREWTNSGNDPIGGLKRWFQYLWQRFFRRQQDPNLSTARVRFQKILAHHRERQSYRAFFGKRGKYVAGPATVSTSFPFGLIVSKNRMAATEPFFVAPELGTLEPTWERRVQSLASGSDSVRRTRSLEEDEFFGLRRWRSGDSRKNIHWRSTAKLGYPMVKQHDQQNNRDFALILDLHAQSVDEVAQRHCETVLSFAATAILQIGSDVQGRVSIAVCGQQPSISRSRSPQGVIADVMPVLAVADWTETPNTIDAIGESGGSVAQGTPIYVISSRRRPASLEMILPSDIDQLASDLSGSATLEQQRLARQSARRLQQVMPMLRWLYVDSPEFHSIFSLDKNEQGVPRIPVPLQQISQKWSADAKH